MTLDRKYLALIAAGALVVLVGAPFLIARLLDRPPEITFTWTPEEPETLRDVQAKLRIVDDKAIDFSSYRFTIVELDKTLDYPIPGVIGRDFEQPISLGLIAGDPRLAGKKEVTIRVSIADDRGQTSELEKKITWTK